MAGPYVDPVTLPFAITITDPRRLLLSGMSRLRRTVVLPANGWSSGRSARPLRDTATPKSSLAPGVIVDRFDISASSGGQRAAAAPRSVEPSSRTATDVDAPSLLAQADDPDFRLVGPAIAGAEALRLEQAVEYSMLEGIDATTPEAQLQILATSAVRYGEGSTAQSFGSNSHAILRGAINELKLQGANSDAEASYLDGEAVREGTPGSIRVDALIDNRKAPEVIYDLKAGTKGLSPARIAEIRRELPEGLKEIPIKNYDLK